MSNRTQIAAEMLAGEQNLKREAFFGKEISMGQTLEIDELDAEVDVVLAASGDDDGGIEAEIDAILESSKATISPKVAAQADVDMWNRTLYFTNLQSAAAAVLGGQRQGESEEEIAATIQAYDELYGVQPRPLSKEQRAGLLNQATRELTDQWSTLERQAKIQQHNKNADGLQKTEAAQGRVRNALRAVIQANRDWSE